MNEFVLGWRSNALMRRLTNLAQVQATILLATRSIGPSKLSMVLKTVLPSFMLLATIQFSERTAVAQPPVPQVSQVTTQSENDWVRGTGDQLEFRLRGRLLGGIDGPPPNVHLELWDSERTKSFPVQMDGHNFEAWLPAKAFTWLSVHIIGSSSDGRQAVRPIPSSQLHSALSEGVDLTFKKPIRSVAVSVQQAGNKIANANVKAATSLRMQHFQPVKTDASGTARIGLLEDESLMALTAWTEQGQLGGYQFQQKPERDPKASEHTIELLECESRTIHVEDEQGSPVRAQVCMHIATPEPNFNYFGQVDGSVVETDASGNAQYRWFPKLKGAYNYAELVGNDWVLQSQSVVNDRTELVVKRPATRVRVEGSLSRGGQYVGGTVIEARSFQGESEGQGDVCMAIADQDGNFAFDALPQSTYCVMVHDDRWVSEPSVFTPVDAATGKKSSPYLTVLDGQPVTIALTTGESRRPIAGQAVSLISEYTYSWQENGKQQTGTTHRQIFAKTDARGIARAYAPLGSLKASVYTSGWRSASAIQVQPGKENRIELHRAKDTPVSTTGRLVIDKGKGIDLSKSKVYVQAVDGERSDELTPLVDETGAFRFSTKAMALACMAISDDGSLAGTALISNVDQPFDIALSPTAYLEGQLLDAEGKAIANHVVYAYPSISNDALRQASSGFSATMVALTVQAKTNAEGIYRIGPLPRLTEVRLRCAKLDAAESGSQEHLGEFFIEPGEQRPRMVHRLGHSTQEASKQTVEQKMNSLLRDARLGGFHAMVILSDKSDEQCDKFVDEQFLDYDISPQVSGYMQLLMNTGADANVQSLAYAKQQKWTIPSAGQVAAVALNSAGKELGRIVLDVSEADAKYKATQFVNSHTPPLVDSRQKWNDAFTLAKTTNRRVWVRVSQRYCGPCQLLNRWIDDHLDVLEKEFVILKIDDVRDKDGVAIAEEVTGGRRVGVPFFAFYDANGRRLIDSLSPTGNIGFMSDYEGKRHFRKMLEKARQKLTDAEIDQVLASLPD